MIALADTAKYHSPVTIFEDQYIKLIIENIEIVMEYIMM
jgi:hypothetical protein